MEQRLSMITLGVADLAASVRFYEDVVGWRHYKLLARMLVILATVW